MKDSQKSKKQKIHQPTQENPTTLEGAGYRNPPYRPPQPQEVCSDRGSNCRSSAQHFHPFGGKSVVYLKGHPTKLPRIVSAG